MSHSAISTSAHDLGRTPGNVGSPAVGCPNEERPGSERSEDTPVGRNIGDPTIDHQVVGERVRLRAGFARPKHGPGCNCPLTSQRREMRRAGHPCCEPPLGRAAPARTGWCTSSRHRRPPRARRGSTTHAHTDLGWFDAAASTTSSSPPSPRSTGSTTAGLKAGWKPLTIFVGIRNRRTGGALDGGGLSLAGDAHVLERTLDALWNLLDLTPNGVLRTLTSGIGPVDRGLTLRRARRRTVR